MSGATFIKVFRWTGLLLVSILLNTGIQNIIYSGNGQSTLVGPSSIVASGEFFLHIALNFFLLLAVLIFVLRYLVWSPWAIYRKIWDLADDGSSSVLPSQEELVSGLARTSRADQIGSLSFLAVEFYLAFLILSCLTNTKLMLSLLIVLPVIDFLPFLIVLLLRVLIFLFYDVVRLFTNEVLRIEWAAAEWRKKARGVTDLPLFFLFADFMDFLFPAMFLTWGSWRCSGSFEASFPHLLQHLDSCRALGSEVGTQMLLVLVIFTPSLVVIYRYRNSLRRIRYVLEKA